MIEKMFSYPVFFSRLSEMKKGIYEKVSSMKATAYVSDEPVPKREWKNLAFKPFPKGKHWTRKKFGCCVFRFEGSVPQKAKGKKIVALIKVGAEGEAYIDGKPVCGVTPVMATIDVGQPLFGKQAVPLYDCAEGGEKVKIEVDCGHNGYCGVFLYDPRLIKADIAIVNEEKKAFYYDCLNLFLTICTYEKNEFLAKKNVKEIKQAFNEAYELYRKGDIPSARKTLCPFFENKQTEGVEYTAVGHGHLDLAWKWPLREGKRKAVRTFSNVVTYLKDYDFVFGASQAQMFEWVEQSEKELFEEVKKAVKSGGIEIQGGMWTECDCNVPCGESLIRQFLYGEKYFDSKFGVSSPVVWLPDAFGFPYTLPQIIKGVGKKYFMTIKLHRNKYNKFPLQSFLWTGPDGSEVVAHIAPEGSYCCSASPMAFVKADNKNVQKETGNALVIYGVSDGGGGPGEGHLEMLSRAGGKYAPKATSGSAESLFRKLERADLPRYDGELYLETHQGTYTSQAKNKYFNKLTERKLHNLEWLEALTGDKFERRDEMWKRTLTNQFHDILPGSGIKRVHKESVEDYAEVCEILDKAIEKRAKKLALRNGLCALNPSPFEIDGNVIYNGELYRIACKPYSSCRLVKSKTDGLNASGGVIENKLLKITVDRNSGEIISVIDKEKNLDYAINGLFHSLILYSDPKTRFDAWDIDREYLKLPKKKPTLLKITSTVTGECAQLIAEYEIGKSKIQQKIYVKDTKNIFFETQAEWFESHKMLRARFTPSVYSAEAEYGIQFGSIKRSTGFENETEKARYEVCGQGYACVGSAEDGYVALYGGSKFGYRAQEGEISLNLLRSPTFPDETCDRGEQSFTYAIGFCDDIQSVVKTAYNLDNPPIILPYDFSINREYGVSGEGIITETVKRAEDCDGIVIRAYERFGRRVESELIMPEGSEAFCTDMLERNPIPAGKIIFAPHEIKTILIKEAKKANNPEE